MPSRYLQSMSDQCVEAGLTFQEFCAVCDCVESWTASGVAVCPAGQGSMLRAPQGPSYPVMVMHEVEGLSRPHTPEDHTPWLSDTVGTGEAAQGSGSPLLLVSPASPVWDSAIPSQAPQSRDDRSRDDDEGSLGDSEDSSHAREAEWLRRWTVVRQKVYVWNGEGWDPSEELEELERWRPAGLACCEDEPNEVAEQDDEVDDTAKSDDDSDVAAGVEGGEVRAAPPVSTEPALHCRCLRPDDGSMMVECENDEGCPIGWFHGACVNLAQAEEEPATWFCPSCWPRMDEDARRRAGPQPTWSGPSLYKDRAPTKRSRGHEDEGEESGRPRKRRREDDETEVDSENDTDLATTDDADSEFGGRPRMRRALSARRGVDGLSPAPTVVGEEAAGAAETERRTQVREGGPEAGSLVGLSRRKCTSWTATEERLAIGIMAELMYQGRITGDARWGEISRLLAVDHQISRSGAAVKNQWNRVLRQRCGLDERKPSAQGGPMQTGLQTSRKG
ncbi:MAG: hypothetical protein M1832_004506 [Thelocarpon impressellum]|nr:MAG: hypothetical protein M1832_004506 [Thelocarpon impressellum]